MSKSVESTKILGKSANSVGISYDGAAFNQRVLFVTSILLTITGLVMVL